MDCRAADLAAAASSYLGGRCAVRRCAHGGLGVFATRPIAAGTRIVVERPLVLTPLAATRLHTCAVCLADSRRSGEAEWALSCAICHHPRYCTHACAAIGAQLHTATECAAFVAAPDHFEGELGDLVVQAVRLLSMRAHGTELTLTNHTGEHTQPLLGSYKSYGERLTAIRRSIRTGALIQKVERLN